LKYIKYSCAFLASAYEKYARQSAHVDLISDSKRKKEAKKE